MRKKKMQLISIIMPYYRKINSVNRAIKSVINQSYKKFELIIVYDDNILEDYHRIINFIGDNKKIKIIKNKRNVGAGQSRNIGIKESKNSISICFFLYYIFCCYFASCIRACHFPSTASTCK